MVHMLNRLRAIHFLKKLIIKIEIKVSEMGVPMIICLISNFAINFAMNCTEHKQ